MLAETVRWDHQEVTPVLFPRLQKVDSGQQSGHRDLLAEEGVLNRRHVQARSETLVQFRHRLAQHRMEDQPGGQCPVNPPCLLDRELPAAPHPLQLLHPLAVGFEELAHHAHPILDLRVGVFVGATPTHDPVVGLRRNGPTCPNIELVTQKGEGGPDPFSQSLLQRRDQIDDSGTVLVRHRHQPVSILVPLGDPQRDDRRRDDSRMEFRQIIDCFEQLLPIIERRTEHHLGVNLDSMVDEMLHLGHDIVLPVDPQQVGPQLRIGGMD